MKKNPIQTVKPNHNEGYITWDSEAGKVSAFKRYGDALEHASNISKGYRNRDYSNLSPGISGKPGLTQRDYDFFRPDEMIPIVSKEICLRSDFYYRTVGLVRNIIDLMGDFTCQGIRIVHPTRRTQTLYEGWWNNMIQGNMVSNQFCNLLYRFCNVPVQVYTANLRDKQFKKVVAEADRDGLPEIYEAKRNEIPYKYVFHHPYYIENIGGPLSDFADVKRYGIKLPENIRRMIVSPMNEQEKEVVASLPAEIIAAARTNKPYPLPDGKFDIYYYKKDDWRTWADPIIYSIMDDLEVLDKMKLADKCALDGAISKIRIFKLGNMEHNVVPSAGAFAKFADILENSVGGGTIDIVWGPDVELIETATDAYQYLGEEKYKATMQRIYEGLGVPPTLTGTFGAAGTTNNFISLKTLTERLEYGRSVLTQFWNAQLKLMQKALGHRFPAQIEFDKPILSNEDSEKQLLIQLADRNLISDELLQRKFGQNYRMETIRLNREARERESGKRQPKAGQWYNPQPEVELTKIALQSGQITPSEAGLELEDKEPGQKTMLDKQAELQKQLNKDKPKTGPAIQKKKPKGRPGQGRPKTKKDSKKRKTKTFKPRSRSSATLELWAKDAQRKVADILIPIALANYGKKNVRSLTEEEYEDLEKIKFGVLSNLKPYSEVNEESVNTAIANSFDSTIYSELEDCISFYHNKLNKEPTIDEVRDIQVKIYANKSLMEQINVSNTIL